MSNGFESAIERMLPGILITVKKSRLKEVLGEPQDCPCSQQCIKLMWMAETLMIEVRELKGYNSEFEDTVWENVIHTMEVIWFG